MSNLVLRGIRLVPRTCRGGEWYLEKRGSRKILVVSRNLGSVFDKSRNLVFAWFVFTFFESRNFLPKSLRLGFLTRISASRRVSDFTIRHPYLFQPSKQTGLFDVILAKRILRAKDKSDRVCSSCGRKMKTLHQLYSFVSRALFSSENWESGRKRVIQALSSKIGFFARLNSTG